MRRESKAKKNRATPQSKKGAKKSEKARDKREREKESEPVKKRAQKKTVKKHAGWIFRNVFFLFVCFVGGQKVGHKESTAYNLYSLITHENASEKTKKKKTTKKTTKKKKKKW